MQKYIIKKISEEKAQHIWNVSSNASIYTNPNFLKLQKGKYYWICAYKGDEEICAWPLMIEKKNLIIPNFFYYFGPIWKNYDSIKNHSWLSLSKNIYELFIKYFDKNFKKIDFQLDYNLLDVRIFDWWKYGVKKGRYNIKPKYSALIENLDKKNEAQILSDFRYWRRKEVKILLNNPNIIRDDNVKLKEISDLYRKIVFPNKKKLDKELLKHLNGLYQAVINGFGKFICFRENDVLQSFSLILLDKKSAHLVLTLTDEKYKKKGLGALNIFSCIKIAKNVEKKIFDFNGANSPDRGDDKHSYGAKSKLFFEINKNV
tara:strand:+ start:209 stop:1156 length:948 start_codon:yes stop_codon:yes gene_type:complete